MKVCRCSGWVPVAYLIMHPVIDEMDTLFETATDIRHSIEDADYDLETIRSRLLHSMEFVNDMRIIHKEKQKGRSADDLCGFSDVSS